MALGTLEHGGRVRCWSWGFPNSILQFAETAERKCYGSSERGNQKDGGQGKGKCYGGSQLIPNFDPNMLSKIPTTPTTPITPIPPIPQEQSPKNPMSDKASCSNVRAPELDEDNPMNDADAAENR
ncbi:unnamed protein product [Prunus armeniaca]